MRPRLCDVLRGRKPPFDPASVAGEYAQLAKDYHCGTVVGDAYAGEWVAAAFKKNGVDYRRSKQPRSILYLESMPHFMRGAVSIPDHARLLWELRLLERRTSPSGKDVVDHGKGGSDDYANSLCGCIAITLKQPREAVAEIGTIAAKIYRDGTWINGPPAPAIVSNPPPAISERRVEELKREAAAKPPSPPSVGLFVSKLFHNEGR